MERIEYLLSLFAHYQPELVTDADGNVIAIKLVIPTPALKAAG